MVFEWFFSKGCTFKKLKKELKKAEILDIILDNLLDNNFGYEQSIRARVEPLIYNLRSYLEDFNDKLKKQEEVLKLYIETSLEQKNFLNEINRLIFEIIFILDTLNRDFHKDDYLTFVDETIELRDDFKKKIKLVEEIMKRFHEQSKKSLEWNYESGTNNIDERIFRSKVSDLGGEIDTSRGKGDHFLVRFKIFQNTLGPSRKNKGQISGGTLSGFID